MQIPFRTCRQGVVPILRPLHRFTAVVPVLFIGWMIQAPALRAAGWVRAWGSNAEGQSLAPAGLNDGVSLAAGPFHSVVLRSNGTLIAWGWNLFGETNVPALLPGVAAVSANYGYTVALLTDGSVRAWGQNPAVAVPADLQAVAIAAGYDHAVALREDGTLTSWGNAPVPLPGIGPVAAVAAGRRHTLALLQDGSLAAWGEDTSGKTSLVPTVPDVIAIAAGEHHNLALRANGTVLAWGDNTHGQCSVPAGLSNVVAIAAGTHHSLALRADGTVVGWGRNDFGQATPPAALSGVVAIAAGANHSLALVGDGKPVITVPPRPRLVMLDSPMQLHVKALGQPPLAYQWFKDGVPLSGATRATFDHAAAQPEHEGLYSVLVSNALGVTTSSEVRVRVLPVPPRITVEPSDATFACGGTGTLSATAAGSSPLYYHWYFRDAPVAGATRSVLRLDPITPETAGPYHLVVTNPYGSATSRVALVTVDGQAPTIVGPATASGKQGQPFSAFIQARYSPLSFGAWGLPPGLTLDPTNGLIQGIPLQSGTFTVLLSATNACTHTTATLTLRIDSSFPVITSPPMVSGTEGESLTYQITATENPSRFAAVHLPAGLSLDPTTGLIRGVPAQAGQFDVTVAAANDWGETRSTIRFAIAPRQLGGLAIANVTYTYSSPYLLDFQFSLYDGEDPTAARPVVVPPQDLLIVAKENDRPISTNETAWLLSPRAGLGKLIKAVLVLDFSWSIASLVNGDANTNGLSDALEAMIASAQKFLEHLPAGSQVGVVEFHREDQDPVIVQPLTTDVRSVQDAIAGIWTNHVQGFPAGSRVWDAIGAALTMLGPSNVDEQRYVVFVSDGRDESSSSTVEDLIQTATNANVRIYGLAFGIERDPDDLRLLTTATSGRLVEAETPEELTAQIGQLTQDVAGQYILRWATLRRGNNAFMPSFEVHYQGLVAYSPTNPVWTNYDDPIVDTNATPPTTNYPLVTNYIIGWFHPADHAGDVTLGILRLVPDEQDGQPALTLRARYIPRFIRQIQLRYRPNWPCVVGLLSTNRGELLHGWTLSETRESDGTHVLLLRSPDPTNLLTSLPYGAFGRLLRFTFREIDSYTRAFARIEVDNSIYAGTGPQRLVIENTNEFVRVYPTLPYGTPGPWLEHYGFTGDLAAAELSDPDGDGVLTWQEYRADTDPLDPHSRLQITFVPAVPWSTFHQIVFPTSARRTYRVERSLDLQTWESLTADLPGTGRLTTVTDPQPPWTLTQAWYRVLVW